MNKKLNDVSRLCKEFGLHDEKLPKELFKFIKFKTYQSSDVIKLSALYGEKRAFISEGLVFVYEPYEPGGKPTRLVKVFGKNTSLCEIVPNLSPEAIFKVKKRTRMFFMRKADQESIKAIPNMAELNDGINRYMINFKDNWSYLIQRPTKASLDKLFGMFPNHKFAGTHMANLYGMSRSKFTNDTKEYLDELYLKYGHPIKNKPHERTTIHPSQGHPVSDRHEQTVRL